MEFSNPIAIMFLLFSPLCFFIFVKVLDPIRAADEPPYIDPSIPLIGHVIGLLRRKYDYYYDLGLPPLSSWAWVKGWLVNFQD